MRNTEYLSKDILDDNFVKIFYPYHFLQKIVGCSRVDSRDRFISAPSLYQKLHSLIIICIIFVLQFKLFKFTYDWYGPNFPDLHYLCYAITIVQFISFVFNLIHIRFFNGSTNTKLYIKMQLIERSLKLDKDAELSSIQYKTNLATVIYLGSLTVIFVLLAFRVSTNMSVIAFIQFYSESPFTLELAQCCSVMLHFSYRIKVINGIMWNFLYGNDLTPTKSKYINFPSSESIRNISARTNTYNTCDVDNVLRDIFVCFNSFRNLYQCQVLAEETNTRQKLASDKRFYL
jgi:hypothetical protein